MSIKPNAYLFAHFVGREMTPDSEQVYLSVSRDGINWNILNNGRCVLKSREGEKGIRDPFCVRKRDGNGFYIIATDLSIHNRICNEENIQNVWRNARTRCEDNPFPGSRDIMVWETDDLIHWSRGRLLRAAGENDGCAWAPKCIYDENREMYMVFWASTSAHDGYARHRIFRSYTKDFKKLTEPELWIDKSGAGLNAFDIIVYKDNNRYYRVFKTDGIDIEAADTLDGEWTRIESNIRELADKHEGAALYKNIESGEWYLLLDSLHKDCCGYQLFVSDDIESGVFQKAAVKFPKNIIYRHGSVVTITDAEYEKLKEHY